MSLIGRFRCNGLGNVALGRSTVRPTVPARRDDRAVGARPIEIFGQASATEQAAGSAPVVLGAGSLADLAETLREGRPRDNFVAFLLPLFMKMLRACRRTLPAETLPANMRWPFHIELKSLCPGQAPKLPSRKALRSQGLSVATLRPTILVLWKTGIPCS
jgi:hypothetical protein